jgi:hypothetical protein
MHVAPSFGVTLQTGLMAVVVCKVSNHAHKTPLSVPCWHYGDSPKYSMYRMLLKVDSNNEDKPKACMSLLVNTHLRSNG